MSALLFIPWFKAEPILLFGKIPLQPFGLLVATGVIVGYKVAERRAKHQGVDPAVLADVVAHVLVGGFVGGHVLDAVFYHPDEVVNDFYEIVNGTFWEGARDGIRFPYTLKLWAGLSSFGGFIGAATGSFVWRWRRGWPLTPFNDVIIYAFPFGWVFGRTGCFVVHDHPGVVTDFPLAVADYQVGQPPFQPRHDLGLYEMLFTALLIPVLLALWNKRFPRGFYLGFIPLVYSPVRFGLDFLRAPPEELGDHADPRYLGLTPGHYASLGLGVVGAYLLWRAYKGKPVEVPPNARWPRPEDATESTGAVEAADDGRAGTGGAASSGAAAERRAAEGDAGHDRGSSGGSAAGGGAKARGRRRGKR